MSPHVVWCIFTTLPPQGTISGKLNFLLNAYNELQACTVLSTAHNSPLLLHRNSEKLCSLHDMLLPRVTLNVWQVYGLSLFANSLNRDFSISTVIPAVSEWYIEGNLSTYTDNATFLLCSCRNTIERLLNKNWSAMSSAWRTTYYNNFYVEEFLEL